MRKLISGLLGVVCICGNLYAGSFSPDFKKAEVKKDRKSVV